MKLSSRVFIVTWFALSACGGGLQIKSVVLPNATSLAEAQRSHILKAYKGMTMALDSIADTQRDAFVRCEAAPGVHEVDITVYSLVAETGYEYHGAPVHWKGSITTKAGLYYELSAEANTAENGIDIRFTSHVRPLVNYEEDRVLGHAVE